MTTDSKEIAIVKSPKTITSSTDLIVPVMIANAGDNAVRRFLEFFTAQIRNKNTREAYGRAVSQFFAWCDDHEIGPLIDIEAIHIASYIEWLTDQKSAPTVKQHLAAIKNLFDWLVVGQILPANPASAVRGPKHSSRKGKTPVLLTEDARTLLQSIPTDTIAGLRDRALIALMTYTFARISAGLAMNVKDVFPMHHRLWVRLKEKGGKHHQMPCHHNLEAYLREYIDAAGLADQSEDPLFPNHRSKNQNTQFKSAAAP